MKKRFGTPTSAKLILQLLTILMCTAFIVACGSDDGGNNNEGEIRVTLVDLVGTYEMTDFSVTTGNKTVRAEDAQTWWGKMQIDTGGTLRLNMAVNQQLIYDDLRLTILEVENDALLLEFGDGCEQYIDMNLDGDNITLIAPEGECMEDVSIVLEMIRTDNTTTKDDSDDEDDGSSAGDITLTDLVGTYDLTDFSMRRGVETYEDEDFSTWSGEVEITANGIFTLDLVANQTTIFDNLRLRIVEVENTALLIGDNTCRQYISMIRSGNNITLNFPEGDCLGDISMVLGMQRVRNTFRSILSNEIDHGSDSQFNSLKEQLEVAADSLN